MEFGMSRRIKPKEKREDTSCQHLIDYLVSQLARLLGTFLELEDVPLADCPYVIIVIWGICIYSLN